MGHHDDCLGLLGERIAGKYLVTAVVERTRFSIVYRATHVIWRRRVAIKVFHVDATLPGETRAELLEGFVREGALLAELSETCSAVCQARDISLLVTKSGERVPYMVLEWLEGESLEVVLSRERAGAGRRRSIAEVVSLLSPIAEAIACAHARGVVHCDIKPGNIVLLGKRASSGPRCKLFDFGIAKVVRTPKSKRLLVIERSFTPAFGAPEQFDSTHGATGPWTDVYALALIVVELVSGREALRGDDVAKLAWQSCDPDRRPTPRGLGIDVGDEIERVLLRALAVRPWDRFPDARSFWNEMIGAASRPSDQVETRTQEKEPHRVAGRATRIDAQESPASAIPRARRVAPTPPPLSRARARRSRLSTVVAVALATAVVVVDTQHTSSARGLSQGVRGTTSALARSH